MAHFTDTADDAFDISHIAGNASDDLKRLIGDPGSFFASRRPGSVEGPIFAESIQKRLKCTEISINRKAEEERKLEARYVVETEVTEGMRTFDMGASLRITLEIEADDKTCYNRYVEWWGKHSRWVFSLPGRYVSTKSLIHSCRRLTYEIFRCSSLALFALASEGKSDVRVSVSQSLNIVYHSPAQLYVFAYILTARGPKLIS